MNLEWFTPRPPFEKNIFLFCILLTTYSSQWQRHVKLAWISGGTICCSAPFTLNLGLHCLIWLTSLTARSVNGGAPYDHFVFVVCSICKSSWPHVHLPECKRPNSPSNAHAKTWIYTPPHTHTHAHAHIPIADTLMSKGYCSDLSDKASQ